jgi:hypothetical protein
MKWFDGTIFIVASKRDDVKHFAMPIWGVWAQTGGFASLRSSAGWLGSDGYADLADHTQVVLPRRYVVLE